MTFVNCEQANSITDRLFAQQRYTQCRAADRIFVFLLIAQWFAGVVAATIITPRTWIGDSSQVHLHVWVAIFLGMAISSVPIWLAMILPGKPVTRHCIAIAQMLWSGLLIHLTGGRIETHFHVFGSLAILSFYRDWRVLVTASVVVAGDHFVRGIWWPQSVFGVFVESPYRWLEHGAWVLFEDAFLATACVRGIRETRELCSRQASLELINQQVEDSIQIRTSELQEANKQLTLQIAERNELQEQLRHSQKMEAIGTLAGGVAHEFNNLLQAIRGYTKFAMKGLDEEESRYTDLERVLEAADRAAEITSQLLGFSHRQVLRRQDVDPSVLIPDLMDMLKPLLGEHIQQESHVEEGIGRICVDPTLLHQVLMNLCINARDAMPDGGRLRISARSSMLSQEYCDVNLDVNEGYYAILEVSDTGSGMTREVQERIFEPFFTTKEVGEGTGLGLSMVHGVIKQHGGAVHVYSELALGTTFRIYFPAIKSAGMAEQQDEVEYDTGGSETILVAEDDPLVREFIVRTLSEAGYHALSASDGRQAVQMFHSRANTIDMVLLDVVMPEMNGRMVYHAIRELRPETKVVFYSGYDDEMNFSDFVTRENLRLVRKPVEPNELLQVIRKTLDEKPASAVV